MTEIEFCNKCDNLLYLYSNQDNDKLYLGCKFCGEIKDYDSKHCIYILQIFVFSPKLKFIQTSYKMSVTWNCKVDKSFKKMLVLRQVRTSSIIFN